MAATVAHQTRRRKLSAETKRRMRAAHLGRLLSKSHKRAIARGMRRHYAKAVDDGR